MVTPRDLETCPCGLDVESRSTASSLRELVALLTFEMHLLRVGLEISLCVFLYAFLNLFFPWSAFGVIREVQPLWAWFVACMSVAVFDQMFLCRAVRVFRKAVQLNLAGCAEEALAVLESINPGSGGLLVAPELKYHLLRAEILLSLGLCGAAEQELELAQKAGGTALELHLLRSKIIRASETDSAVEQAKQQIQEAKRECGETAILDLEEALLLLEAHEDLFEARRLLKSVCDLPPVRHSSGESTFELARAGLEAAKLWTGQAEDGLEGLNIAIDRLRGASLYNDGIRPLLAVLYLQRGLYLATHREPQQACVDLKIAQTLCNTPTTRRLSKRVKEELEWRHQILLPS